MENAEEVDMMRANDIAEQLRFWAQNEEMIDSSFTQHGRVCNAAADEIARLREAIKEFAEAFYRDPIKYSDLMDQTGEAVELLCEIAREEVGGCTTSPKT